MAGSASQELYEYRNELRSIINELKDVEYHVRNDFKNVGNDRCADSIKSVINKYESALKTLNSISPSTLDSLKLAAQQEEAQE